MIISSRLTCLLMIGLLGLPGVARSQEAEQAEGLPSIEPAPLIQILIDDDLNDEKARIELLIFHGQWDALPDEAELTPDQRARLAMLKYELDDPILSDPKTDALLPVDVQDMGIDFLSADGHKWLLGPEGCGIFYCREELCPLLRPSVVGWMNMVDADNYGDYRFEFQPDARRFEPGSWNIPGILGLGASIDMLLEVGIENVWARVDALAVRLCEGLAEKGYDIFSPRTDPDERSGIVIFSAPDRLGGSDSHHKIVHELGQQKIVIALREGKLRVSPHFYNTAEQIDRLVEALP